MTCNKDDMGGEASACVYFVNVNFFFLHLQSFLLLFVDVLILRRDEELLYQIQYKSSIFVH